MLTSTMDPKLQAVFGISVFLLAISPGTALPQTTKTKNSDICDIINDRCKCASLTDQLYISCKFGKGLEEKSQTLLQARNLSEADAETYTIGHLDLSGSDMSVLSSNFLAGVSRIQTLTAQYCRLAQVPQALLTGPKVHVLDLSNNYFTVFSLNSVSKLGMRELHIESNILQKITIKKKHPHQLTILNASHNKLSELPFESWQQMQDVYITNNTFSVLPALPSPSQLRILDISENSLSEFPTDFLEGTPSLHTLILARNRIHLPNTMLPGNMTLSKLWRLSLSGNRIQEVSPGLLGKCPHLQDLDLSHNNLTSLLHDHNLFPQHTFHLQSLNLSHNSLVHLHPSTFFHLHHLRDLDLSYNQGLGMMGVDHVDFPEHLTNLDLSHCSLEHVSYCQLSHLHDLTVLNLDHNPLKCTCDLYMLFVWYRNRIQVKKAVDEMSNWQCLSNNTETAVSAFRQSCSVTIQCLSADPVKTVPDVHVSVSVILAEHNLIASWTVSNISKQVHGFRVFYTHQGVEVGKEAMEGAVHVSPVLGVALRTYALTNIETGQSYTVCVDVLSNETFVLKRVCESVKGELPNVLVGILAGVCFLIPCITFVIFILIKDRTMPLNNLSYQIEVCDHQHHHGDLECHAHGTAVETVGFDDDECQIDKRLSKVLTDTTDGHSMQPRTVDQQAIPKQTIATHTDATWQDLVSQALLNGTSAGESVLMQQTSEKSSMQTSMMKTPPNMANHGNSSLTPDDVNVLQRLPSNDHGDSQQQQGESQEHSDPLTELDSLVAELQVLISGEEARK